MHWPGAAARWDALSAALRAAPIELEDGSTVTYDFLIAATGVLLDEPETEWAGPSLLDTLADAAVDDRTTAVAPAIQVSLVDQPTVAEQSQTDYICPANPNPFATPSIGATNLDHDSRAGELSGIIG